MIRIVCLLIGYVFGLFQTAYIMGKAKGIDIREHGSGNAGTTNTLRVLGKKAGLFVFLGDVLKTVAAVVTVYFIFRNRYPEMIYLLKLYAGLGAILGHNFPFYLKFKGGKGIASMGGMILAFQWMFIPVGFVLFFGTFGLTNYVSLGSLIMSAGFFIQMLIFGICRISVFADIPQNILYEMYMVAFIISGLAFLRHHSNIMKLIHKEERKTYLFKKNKVDKE
ncbi:MAG TPA: glycerol-3-phosphate 1-O-acyltransferase PlsY [Lachnospiraceae bacterium]|nr:glycerol-3-phosphate 1-O-acyltransferase PlsY [Lachnospiraceae bacterium]